MRINFDFTDLEAFLAVKETGSFHLASEKLSLSQSSITRRIQKLETALDSVLFVRTTREVKPTLAAKRLQLRAESILDSVTETTSAMRDESAAFHHQKALALSVATIPTVMAGLVVPAIRAFRDAGHQARIRLLDLTANEVAEAVAQGDADFGICSIPMLEPTTEFDALFADRLVLAVHPDHALADKGTIAWSELDGEPLILPARGTGNRLLIDEALARTRLPISWVYEVGRSTTALDLAADGIGVAPLPKTALDGRHTSHIALCALTEPVVSRQIGLLQRVGQRDAAVAAALKTAIKESANDRLPVP
ncbi:MAG: LysR family transcriptional regulator [Pseudomonadota bacterium]